MITQHQEEAIRALAYKFWEEEGRPEGRAESHWLRAVAEARIPDLRFGHASVKSGKKSKSKR